ncbi:MAG: YggT family protein, partial [Chloroflexi bacterium]|nr:YggT family protein [Chloroflexota bacterium]
PDSSADPADQSHTSTAWFSPATPTASDQTRGVRYIQIRDLITWCFAVIEILIILRFMLQLIGANTRAAFTAVVYAISSPFTGPFIGVVPSITIGAARIELSDILAIAIYALAATLLTRLIHILFIDPLRR